MKPIRRLPVVLRAAPPAQAEEEPAERRMEALPAVAQVAKAVQEARPLATAEAAPAARAEARPVVAHPDRGEHPPEPAVLEEKEAHLVQVDHRAERVDRVAPVAQDLSSTPAAWKAARRADLPVVLPRQNSSPISKRVKAWWWRKEGEAEPGTRLPI